MLRIGSAQSDITPPLPIPMGGSFLKFKSRELLDPIMASCVAADDGPSRTAVVSCDLGSVPRGLVLSAREKAAEATGIPEDSIHIMATHNHSGPTVHPASENPFAGDNELALVERIREKLAVDIAACIIEAHDRLMPARMGYGCGRFDGGAFNRRFIMSNGRSRMHGGKNLERLKPEGPTDREAQAVWFEDHEGKHLAVMVNYTSHPTNFYGMPTVSADFPGVMRNILQGVLGDELPVLYLQGACGNIMCHDIDNPNHAGGIDNSRRIGRGLAGEVLRIMSDNFAGAGEARVASTGRTVDIPYREVPPLPADEAAARWEHYKTRWEEFRALDIEERAAINSTFRLAAFKEKSPACPVEISAFALGDVLFVTNPAELFVEYQLDIKERFKDRRVIVTELTNGRIGYVPTRLACALGGYEAIQTRFNPGAGETIRDIGCELIESLLKEPIIQRDLSGSGASHR